MVFYVLLTILIQRRGRKHERMKQCLVKETHTDLQKLTACFSQYVDQTPENFNKEDEASQGVSHNERFMLEKT